ncbi:hypothetical protein MRX96_042633 [Rhipicephalus microplus]
MLDGLRDSIINVLHSRPTASPMEAIQGSGKDDLWPDGFAAEIGPERDQNTKLRTRLAAKMIMLCSLTDELKHIIGSDMTRQAMLCVLEMFQHARLN